MIEFARALAIAAGERVAAAFRRPLAGGIDYKGRRDLVTSVDREVEQFVAARISAAHPDDAILAEENIRRPGRSGRVWIVDPLDGTTNFVHGHPMVCVSIALAEGYSGTPRREQLAPDARASGFFANGALPQPRMGVVAAPILGEVYWAQSGHGAWRCRRDFSGAIAEPDVDLAPREIEAAERLRVSETTDLEHAFVGTGFAYRMNELTNSNLGNFASMSLRVQAIRRGGSAALDLCYVAAGHFDAFWELYLKPWDVAAGVLLITESGGVVTDFDGGQRALEGVEIIASNGRLHERIRPLLEKPDPAWAQTERDRLHGTGDPRAPEQRTR